MNNYNIYKKLLTVINNEYEAFQTLVNADNSLGLNVTCDDIINYLEFSPQYMFSDSPIAGNILITEGDILSILKIFHNLINYEGEFILYINNDNPGTITYLVTKMNEIYKNLNINIVIKIDYSNNYNDYLNSLVTIIGSEEFVETAKKDFKNANQVIV